jgi:thymidine phosphorylase
MSKKIAEGTAALVLDVKVGSGAFMKRVDDARILANTMVQLGCDAGVRTAALVTAMDTPLGRTAGNALEVSEALEVLAGGGPDDVVELTLTLAREMLTLIGITDIDPADRLSDGTAMDRWRLMVAAQSGDPDAPLPRAVHSEQVCARSSGVLTRLDANSVGMSAWRLGAGRARQGQPVQSAAGIEMHVKPGEPVRSGQPILTLHTNTPTAILGALAALDGAWEIGSRAENSPLVIDRIV